MKTKYSLKKETYDGSQLRHLFGYLDHDTLGDSIISWRGPCNVPSDKIIDGEDLKSQGIIASKEMLHFIIEKFESTLFLGVALQRIFVSLIQQDMQKRGVLLTRKGDDLYFVEKNNPDKKFNISVATQTTVSSMIHLAVNITTKDTPVPTVALNDFNISSDEDIKKLSEQWMLLFSKEIVSMIKATQKVFLI